MSDRHPTNEELLGLRHDLLEGQARDQVKAHLAGCDACRGRLAYLTAKLGGLDLIKAEVAPPADVVARVKALAQQPAAGASPAATPPRPLPQATAPRTEVRPWRRTVAWLAAAAGIGIALSLLTHLWEPQPGAGAGTGHATLVSQDTAAVPFAPGSNIELNVLPTRDSVQLTIYNSADLTLVREHRKLTLKKGWNWLQFMWANTLIDPTSLELRAVGAPDKVGVVQLVYPPRTKGLGRWLVKSDVSGPVDCEITYFTSGIHWRTFYVGTLTRDEKTMTLEAYVRVDNGSGDDYEKAQTRLIVGKINLLDQIAVLAQRAHAYGEPNPEEPISEIGQDRAMDRLEPDMPAKGAAAAGEILEDAEKAPKEIKKEGLSEYFLYTIEGTETIPNGWGKRLPSFAKPKVPVANLYKFDEERWGEAVERFLSFKNDEEHTLGETPVPDGMVRVFAEARTGPGDRVRGAEAAPTLAPWLSYVGGTSIKYIPVGEKVELELGPAEQVQVKPTLMATATENFTYDQRHNVDGWDDVQTWQIELNNTRDIPVQLEITRATGNDYWRADVTAPGVTYAKHDANHLRFTTELAPRTKISFTYVLRLYNGKRQEQR